MPTELQLINTQRLAGIAGIAGYLYMLYSLNLSEKLELRREGSPNISPPEVDPSKPSATSAWLRVIALVILSYVGIARLQQSLSENPSGSDPASINPTVKIAAGAVIGLIGILLVAIGAQERANEPGAQLGLI